MHQWQRYRYYEIFRGKFSASECDQIIQLRHASDRTLSRLHDSAGNKLRNSNLFWVRRTRETDWIFQRVQSVVLEYNKTYEFELLDEINTAQLTRYAKNQQYGWHVDLGAKQSSLRKVSAVVELTPEGCHVGGGIEIFYGDTLDNKVELGAGDIVVFPSFVTHRASRVESGVRWSLVFWFEGPAPFK